MTEGLVPVIDLEPVLLKENPTEEIDNAKETRELPIYSHCVKIISEEQLKVFW